MQTSACHVPLTLHLPTPPGPQLCSPQPLSCMHCAPCHPYSHNLLMVVNSLTGGGSHAKRVSAVACMYLSPHLWGTERLCALPLQMRSHNGSQLRMFSQVKSNSWHVSPWKALVALQQTDPCMLTHLCQLHSHLNVQQILHQHPSLAASHADMDPHTWCHADVDPDTRCHANVIPGTWCQADIDPDTWCLVLACRYDDASASSITPAMPSVKPL